MDIVPMAAVACRRIAGVFEDGNSCPKLTVKSADRGCVYFTGRGVGEAGDPVRIVCAVSWPLARAASTVPISVPASSASPEKNMASPFGFFSTDCASRVLGVA